MPEATRAELKERLAQRNEEMLAVETALETLEKQLDEREEELEGYEAALDALKEENTILLRRVVNYQDMYIEALDKRIQSLAQQEEE